MTLDTALDVFTHAITNGADSLTLATLKADLDAATRAHIYELYQTEQETL